MRRDAFYGVHPAVSMAFFLAVMLITAFVLHPVLTGVSLIGAVVCAVRSYGRRAVKFIFAAALPVCLLAAALNPVFNHAGVRVLFYFDNGNAVTLEAVLYGLNSGCMFAALLIWSLYLSRIMTGDKYIFLFGRALPALSLVFSMVLRFIPRMTARIREVSAAQRSVAPPLKKGPAAAIKHGLQVLSVTVTWALESAVTASDSMKSRGYGLKGRTAYALYSFEARDALLLGVMLAASAVTAAAVGLKQVYFRYYPSIKFAAQSGLSWAAYAAFAVLCLLPVLLNVKEAVSWRISISKI